MQNNIIKIFFLLATFFMLPQFAHAACSGTYPNPIAACASVTSTVHIPGGTYATPYVISQTNTEYILDGNITAAGTAIQIKAAPIVIDLNGYTITYNTTTTGTGYDDPSGGIVTDAYNLNNNEGDPVNDPALGIGISNGYIVQAPSQTTFASAINATQTSIPVANSGVFHTGEYLIAFTSQSDQTVNVEYMLITGISGNTLTVTRGANGTTAAAHDNTAVVFSSRGSGLGFGDTNSDEGIENNPILTKPFGANYTQADSVNATYSGLDVSGFVLGFDYATVTNCTLTDTMGYGWVSYRGGGVYAIESTGSNLTAYGNTIVNTRDRGIAGGDSSLVYNNTISILSVCTNSLAVTFGNNSVMHDNNITGRGEAPIGIEVGTNANIFNHNDPGNPEATGVQIYHNTMDMQITRLGGEYGASTYPGPAAPTASNEFAVGVRSTTGIKNSSIYNNNITVRSFSNYSANYSPTGEPVIISGADAAKGIMVGLRWNDESLNVYGNIISAIDSDGSGEAIGISCSANMDDRYGYLYPQSQGYYIPKSDFRPALNIYSNTITSNLTNIAIGDEYGGCDGYPAIYNNILIKSGNFNSYATYGIGQGFYYGPSYAWLLGNTYSGGAAESSQAFNFADSSHVDTTSPPDYSTGTTHFYRGKDIIFGDVVSGAASLRYSEDNAGGTTESNTPNVTTPPSNSLSLTLPLVPSTSSAPPIVSAYPAPGPYATLPTVYLTCIPQGTASCEPIVYCTGSGCTPSTTYDPDGNGTGITLSGTTTIGYKDTDFNGDAGTTVYGTYTLFLGNTTPPAAPSGLSVI